MHIADATDILNSVDAARQARERVMIAIAGAPGSGKSTLAAELVARINERDGDGTAALLPMDGYHLDNAELDAKGLRAVKGAPETFDLTSFVSLVRKVREHADDLRYPLFDRALDRTLPNAGHLAAGTPVVVFEGNYLLLPDGAWGDLKPLFDVTVMLSVPLPVLRARLVARWLSYGLPLADAEARAEGNDMVNAKTVIAKSVTADLVLRSGEGGEREDRAKGSRPFIARNI